MKKPLKINLPLRGAEAHLARIIKREGNAVIERTAYAITLSTETRRYYFSDGRASVELFAAVNMVRKDIDEREASGLLWKDHATGRHIAYHELPNASQVLPPQCWCVDIKAAYPSTAQNLGLIGRETHRVVMALPKAERLKCLGMLATRKYVERFEGGVLTGKPEAVESPYRHWYLDLCAYVGSVMQEVREATPPDDFIMYWVDGVFTKRPDIAARILSGAGYEVTTEWVEGIRRSSDGTRIHYRKGGKSTYLSVPQRHKIDGASIRERLNPNDQK